MKDFQYITSQHPQYIESLYRDFVNDPSSVDPDLRKFFEGFDFALSMQPASENKATNGKHISTAVPPDAKPEISIDWMKEIAVYRMILGYRNKGHLVAKTNPIRERKDRGANLNLNFFGFGETDLDKDFFAGNLMGLGKTSLKNIQEFASFLFCVIL